MTKTPERWDIGLPAELDEMRARHGVGIQVEVEPGGTEVPFYKFPSQEALLKSIVEADRALVAGAMEYVPDDQVEPRAGPGARRDLPLPAS